MKDVTVVLGLQYGDEGKGKVVDILMEEADICVRFNGGNNAGHTIIVNDKRYALHLLPSGVIRPNTQNFLGGGVVCHIKSFLSECESVGGGVKDRIFISDRCGILLDLHILSDVLEESQRSNQVGTTKKGIGPCCADITGRRGVKMGDLRYPELFASRVRSMHASLLALYPNESMLNEYDVEEEIKNHLEVYFPQIDKQIINGFKYIKTAVDLKKKILCEGANATMLDVDHGTYPYVTSSTTTAGGVCRGVGLPPSKIQSCVGVIKAYTTRIGEGPFITELFDDVGQRLQKVGHEFGTTTGRPRRCGWLDIPMCKFAVWINGCEEVCLTKLDVLTGIDIVKVCTNYRIKSTGIAVDVDEIPMSATMEEIEPQYMELEGWTQDLSSCTRYEALPANARAYVEMIESVLKVKISYIGVGPNRHQTICK